MAHIAQLGRLAVTFLVDPRLGIGRARMGLVGSLLLVEAALGIASRTVLVVVAAILPPKALDRSSGFSQRTVHREVIVREQTLDLRLRQKRVQELGRNLALEQPVAVPRIAPHRSILILENHDPKRFATTSSTA